MRSSGTPTRSRQIAAASGAGIEVDAGALPISDDVRRWHERQGRDPVGAALAMPDIHWGYGFPIGGVAEV